MHDAQQPGRQVAATEFRQAVGGHEERIGKAIIDLLRARRAEPERPIQTVVVPTTLIARGSGEIPA